MLAQIGLDFTVVESRVDEGAILRRSGEGREGRDPRALTVALSLAKAREVAGRVERGLVIGADTVVVLEGDILGKPRDAVHAAEMLGRLQGRWHTVVTGVAVVEVGTGRERTGAEATRVLMRPLEPDAIAAYVASGEPLDKAGAYAIQGLGAALVMRIEGCFYNVVGLPLAALVSMLKEFGVDVFRRGG